MWRLSSIHISASAGCLEISVEACAVLKNRIEEQAYAKVTGVVRSVSVEVVGRLAIYGATYKSFEESLPPELLEVFKQITPETFAPKELKEPYEKLSPSPNWTGLAAKILESMKSFQGFSPEQMKAVKAEVWLGAGDRKDVNLEHLIEMHQLIPKSQLAVFPNTDHLVMMTNPDKALVQVKEFLDNDSESADEMN